MKEKLLDYLETKIIYRGDIILVKRAGISIILAREKRKLNLYVSKTTDIYKFTFLFVVKKDINITFEISIVKNYVVK